MDGPISDVNRMFSNCKFYAFPSNRFPKFRDKYNRISNIRDVLHKIFDDKILCTEHKFYYSNVFILGIRILKAKTINSAIRHHVFRSRCRVKKKKNYKMRVTDFTVLPE